MSSNIYAVITITVTDDGDSIDIDARYQAPGGRCLVGEEVARLVKYSLRDLAIAMQRRENKLNVSEMN